MRAILFLILFGTLFGFRAPAQSDVSTQAQPVVQSDSQPSSDTESVPPPEDERSIQEKIIDFMKSLFEDKPEPIDESLLRDPL